MNDFYTKIRGNHPAVRAILFGLALWLIGAILWMFSGVIPYFATLIDEAIFAIVVIFLGFYLWKNRSKGTAFISVGLIAVGYLLIPWAAKATYFLSTKSTFTGEVVNVYNDESPDGLRRTFVIKDQATGITDEYISRDAIIFPFVFHTDSARTRRNIVPGSKMIFSEYGTRRFKDQIPFVGNFLGLGFVTGDWSSFPNIYSAIPVSPAAAGAPVESD